MRGAMTEAWLTELLGDPVGVQFLGVSRCNELASELMSEAADHADSWSQLCGSLREVVPPKAFARAAAGRSVLKITACATDALRYATGVASAGGKVLWALGSYVGGDVDMAAASTAMRVDNADTKQDAEALPLPYCTPAEATSSDALELERACLHHFIIRVLDGRLRDRPVRVLVLELVLSNNGLELRKEFLEVLGTICATLDVAVVVDETMTLGRAYGCVALQGAPSGCDTSLLAVDAMGLNQALNPRCVVGGKVAGVGIVWGTRQETPSLEPGRGTSTSTGFLRLKFADAVLRKLLEERVDVDSLRAQLTAELTAQLSRNSSHAATWWGRGLILFSNARFERASTDRNTAGRMLPTSALATLAVPVTLPAMCASGVCLDRTERGFKARVASGCQASESDDAIRKLAWNAIKLDKQTGSKMDLKRHLGGEMGLITVCKRSLSSESRSYMIDVGDVIRQALTIVAALNSNHSN